MWYQQFAFALGQRTSDEVGIGYLVAGGPVGLTMDITYRCELHKTWPPHISGIRSYFSVMRATLALAEIGERASCITARRQLFRR